MDRNSTRLIVAAVSVALLVAAFAGGFVIGHLGTAEGIPAPIMERDPEISRAVEEVRGILKDEALNPSNDESMTVGAVQGVLKSLDDSYAMYFDDLHFEYFNEQNEGEFGGVGMTLTGKEGQVVVVDVISGTPAESAGVKPEDMIVGIDETRKDEWDLDEAVKRIRGPEGSEVVLEVRREGEEDLLTFEITRAKIDYPNLMQRMIGKDVGYVRLLSFNAKAAVEIKEALAQLEEEGAEGFVLDLRNNPGGMLESSVDVASLFVEDGVIVRVEQRDGAEEIHRARGRAVTGKPLVVLVNEHSASASEIVAGALKDHGRARIVGMKTFGKGSVQTVRELSTGGAIKYTIAHYLTPKSNQIDGEGLQPDVKVEMKPEDAAEEETDKQLKRAVEELREEL